MVQLVRTKSRSPKGQHPTRALFVQVAVAQLEDHLPEEITVEAVVGAAGLTKGALYHHFADLAELIEVALVVRFSRFVDESIAMLTKVATSARSREDLVAGMAAITAVTQHPDRKAARCDRAHVLTLASGNPRLGAALADEQLRLTDALADLIAGAQKDGWFNRDFDPRAASVLIQAYTLGRIVDDITTQPVEPEAWDRLIMRLIDRVFM